MEEEGAGVVLTLPGMVGEEAMARLSVEGAEAATRSAPAARTRRKIAHRAQAMSRTDYRREVDSRRSFLH